MSGNAPSEALTADQKRALLAQILRARTVRGDTFPLSFAQQRLWLLDRMDPGNPAYNIPSAYRMLGALDPAALRRSLAEVVRRHEVLRTRFALREGSPVQVVSAPAPVPLPLADLRGLGADGRRAEVERQARAEALRPFDLAAGPLLRARLLRVDAEEHVLLICMHHVVSDGWSMGVFFREVAALYGAFSRGEPSPLQDLPTQYADHAVWQRGHLAGAVLERQVGYWRERLAGAPAVLELPTDHPRPLVQGFRGARESLAVDAELLGRLHALARGEGGSLYMVLLAAFQVLLGRWSGQDDVVVGSPVAGRTRRQLEELVGCFMNTLVLRADLSGDPAFRALLAQVRETALGAFAHQDLPFERLVEELAPERSLGHSPLFQALFALQNTGESTLRLAGLAMEPVSAEATTSKNDLSLYAVEGPQGLRCTLVYNPDLFEPATVGRMLGHLHTLLHGIAAEPDRRLSGLRLMDDAEQRRVLEAWNDTARDFPRDLCVHELIAMQARATPDAPALAFGGRELTYAQLDARAGRLAGRLRELGVGPEVRVGICLERSDETVVAMLAVLRAGGAYLPLDPAYPAGRLAFMLRDSGAPVLVTQEPLRGLLPAADLAVVLVDAEADAPAARAAAAPDGGVLPGNAAYVIYTSGSTGTPKGVVVTHANAVSFFAGMDERVGGPVPGTWLAVTRTSFDISVLELLWTLARGFRVVVQPESGGEQGPASPRRGPVRPVAFSLFYFSSGGEDSRTDKYRLLLEGARFADRNGFEAVWTPERHFHAFGGVFPNPAIAAAAVAAVTERIGVRAGSVVLPLHDPVRVAEEWSAVDNLSGGRAGVSFASGWQPDDFVLAPDRFADRRDLMFREIETVRALWRGEPTTRVNGVGKEVSVRILPRPVQAELPVWVTAGGSPDTFRRAGECGARLLTHLLGQSVEELAARVALYREAFRASGAGGEGHVTVMLHTFVGDDAESVRRTVREPFRAYLASSVDLLRPVAAARGIPMGGGVAEGDMDALLDHAFERYWQSSALLGTRESCLAMVERLREAGVDEIACLVDFVDDVDAVLGALPALDDLRRAAGRPEGDAAEDLSVPAQIARHGVTHLQCTPSLAGILLAEEGAGALAPLRRLLLGGEALPPELARELAGVLPGRLVNMYGPTETTVWSLTHPVDGAGRSVPIGRPIANTRVYVLDAHLRPQPVGVPGELYIAGAGVTRGYLERPGLTADRFLPEAFGAEPGARMYRTGDRARWLADGTVEFLGRADQQVKVRGFRIEPGEIEAALRAHPAVADAAVAARADAAGEVRLVAYTVAREGGAPDVSALRAHLGERLPEYMVPAAFVALDAFPLTPNGKLDRRALPEPDFASAGPDYEAPRNAVEEELARIWAGVLRVERVGIRDSFFALGGHSLMAMRMIARVRQALGVEVPLRALFEDPTLAALAARVGGAERERSVEQPIPPRPADGTDPPLSFAQQRLWVLDQLEPESPVYNMPLPQRVRGRLDVAALERALGELVRRHEGLRTTFTSTPDGPVQRIAPPGGFHLPVTDLSGRPDAEAEARRRAVEDAVRVFDLARGPLFRAQLLRLADDDHVLITNMHHVVSDGWSMNVVRRELLELYGAFAAGRPSPLAPLPVQYADYAAWQHRLLAGGEAGGQLAYWRGRLAGAPPVLELPRDRPRPAAQSHRGAWVAAQLPAGLMEAVHAFSRREGVTPFMTLLAGFKAMVARCAGVEDVVVGTPIAGRSRPELEGVVGFFVNSLALRTDLAGDPSFRELVARVKETTLGAYAHQDAPFEQVVEVLQPVRSLSHAPVFQVMFNLLNFEASATEGGGLRLEKLLPHGEQGAKFDLTLYASERGDVLMLELLYAADLFDPDTAERLLGWFRGVLEQALARPEMPLSGLDLLGGDERRRTVDGWGAGPAAPAADVPVHALFEEWARRTPDAPALACEGARFTYAELEALSGRIARFLRARGVGPEVRVGVLAGRSAEAVAALLGVLRAGGACLPLDPSAPAGRLAWMLEDAGARLVLAQEGLAGVLAGGAAEVVGIADAARGAPEAAGPPRVDPRSAAYVIYTSGSTGRPKGVVVEHRQVVGYARAVAERLDLPAGSSFATVSTPAADLGYTSVFGALCGGGCLHVVAEARIGDPRAFAEYLAAERVDVLKITPSHLAALMSGPAPAAVLPRTCLVLGGEASRREWVEEIRALAPGLRVANHYGPTETTVGALALVAAGELPATAGGTVPVGRPLAGCRAYVLDGALRPVPAGVPGELFVGGAQVARGYLGRPGLTAGRFLPDPFSAEPGARMYRTGDRVRWTRGGLAEFLGRADFQVKVRGFRVEPGEVEGALLRLPAVREALVAAVPGAAGEPRLVAWVVPSAGESPAAEALREALAATLPAYMVPAAVVLLDALPLTANGKIDRRALPAPAPEAGEEWVAPRTPLEELLAGVWAGVLRLERVGAGDDFFAIGGHSLLATRVVSRVRDLLGVEVPLRMLFEAPTVASLARRVEALRHGSAPAAPPLAPVARDGGALPLSFAQERLWVLDQMDPGSAAYVIPVALRLSGALDEGALCRAVEEIVRRHEVLRTAFPAVRGRPVQEVLPAGAMSVRVEDLGGLPEAGREAEARRIATDEANLPFDLAAGPPFRPRLLRLRADEHVLLLTLHHAAGDGWSRGVLRRELAALYAAFLRGEPSPLPELPVQYADFAVWQRAWLSGAVLEERLAWWKERLAGAPAVLRLPTDFPRPAVQSHRGARLRAPLPAELMERVGAVGREAGATPFMTLLAAFQLLLSRYAGEQDVVVGTPVAGRTRAEVEPLVGCFVNTLALRTDLSGDPPFRELLARVREATLDAFAHQDLPFEKLVDALGVARSPGHAPVYQVMFALQDVAGPPAELPGLRTTGQELEVATAKDELALVAGPSRDGWFAVLEYCTDLFTRDTAERMLAHFRVLLEGVAENPGARIGDLPLMDAAERRQVAAGWNPLPAPEEAGTLHAAFEARARLHPEAEAVAADGEVLTYAELDRRAGRLARALRARGVCPEQRVGVCVGRGPDLVVALLGTLKAGGVYVPLDPAYPRERLAWLVADAGVRTVVAPGTLAPLLPAGTEVLSPRAGEDPAGGGADAVPPAAGADNLAYVIYTSGSTGTPKGVAVEHGAARAHLLAAARVYGYGPGDRVLHFASPSFDPSLEQVLAPLFAGACVVPRGDDLPAPAELLAGVEAAGVSVVDLPPAYLQQLVHDDAVRAGLAARVRLAIAGGESLPAGAARAWVASGGRLLNAYGPTEAVITATVFEVAADAAGASVPIGRQVGARTLYVLDAKGNPAAVGVPGELHVGGPVLARGYLGRPGATAGRFVPDPFSAAPGARMYRTGDRVRRLASGVLEFLGRTDQQLKVRGFRVEPGEVEALLLSHPAVREAAVVVREDAPGDRRLVAYVAPAPGAAPDPSGLRAFLGERLPGYMVPGALVVLDSLPLGRGGKLDRGALPAPAPERPAAGGVRAAPATPVERVLAEVWAEVLRVGEVGTGDNFFELGGDSILAIQVIARAAQRGVRLTPRQLFQHQTVAALAAQAAAADGPAPGGAEPEALAGPVQFTPVQRWFLGLALPEPHHYNQSVLLAPRERVAPAALERALAAILAHHDALRLRFRRTEAGWEQECEPPSAGVPLDTLDLRGLPAADRAVALEAACAERQASLDLEAGPIARALLAEMGGDEPQRLFACVHHLAVDAVSWRILLEDLESGVRQAARGEEVRLAPRTTSYRRWAERLREHARSAALLAEADAWAAAAGGPAAPLPRDREGANTADSVRSVSAALDAAETRALLRDVPAAYGTRINDVLLTAVAGVLTRWTGGRALRIHLEGHGREDLFDGVDLSRTVGWFTSIFPVRIELPESGDPGEALKAVKEQLRRVPGRGIGYGILRYLGPAGVRARLAGLPAPEVSFNYLGQLDGATAEDRLFATAPEGRGPEVASSGERAEVLEISGAVQGGRLRMVWKFSSNLHDADTVRRLAEGVREELASLVAHCTAAGAGGRTPSDFPLARVTQRQLDALLGAGGADAVEDVYPLAPLQQGMLFESLLAAGGERPYLTQTRYTVHDLDPDALRRAWDAAVERHPVLRTRFAWDGLAEPHQVVERAVPTPWAEEDLRGLAPEEAEARVEAFLRAERAHGFALDRAPLVRMGLLRTSDEAWEWVWTLHHLVYDGWSQPLLLRDVMSLYAALVGRPVPALPAVRPYRDYVAWLAARDRAAAESHWRGVLAGVDEPTPLGIDRPAPAGAEARFHELSVELPARVAERLRALGRGQQVTLNTLVQGAWGLLLSRYAGRDDVVFGAVVSGRPAELDGVEEMLGLFINTLPVRVRVRAGQPAADWLRQLQDEQAGARDFEHTSLVQAQAWSGVPRGTPLFESLLVYESYPVDALRGGGAGGRRALDVRGRKSHERTGMPLTLLVHPRDGLAIRAVCDARRFEREAVERMLEHLGRVLETLALEPRLPVDRVDPLTPAEHARLASWNATGVEYPALACVHHRIEAQADRTPERVALVFEGESLTCRELDRRATRLARYLRGLGVGPEARVGVCMERSAELVVAILAVLKAGGAYVPVDPEYPEERRAYMLADSGVGVVLAQDGPAYGLAGYGGRVVRLAEAWSEVESLSAERFDGGAGPASLAYVIYTSGSTGRPKGAMNAHSGICNRLQWMQARYGLDAGDRVLQKTPFSFDVSVWELLWPLMYGARLVVARPGGHRDPAYLAAAIAGAGITTLHFVPSMLQLFLDEADVSGCEPLRRVVCSGEALPADLAARFFERMPRGVELHNLYGPTEAAVDVTEWECRPGDSAVPIGRPVANTAIHLLDPHLRPVPAGVAGELYIGGVQVGRGYLGRPGLTAERFLPDPFGAPGARMYRTGDLARRRGDGAVEYLGRTDFQVKVRGLRVELGEIEAALAAHPAVREAVVVPRGEGAGVQLVAYLVPADGAPEAAELRAWLGGRLPDYMVPARFVALDSLPLSPSGKTDRRALPAPDAGHAAGGYVAPRTPAEEALAEVWAALLGVERVGAHDGFFELGGHSLLAIRLVSRVRERFGVELPLRAVFEAPELAALAECVAGSEGRALTSIPRADRSRPLPLSFAQQRLWFADQLDPAGSLYNVPSALRLGGRLDAGALERALAEVVRRHESLRTVFAEDDGTPAQVVRPAGGFALRVEEVPGATPAEREAEARRLAAAEARSPFDLRAGPLFRARLLRLDGEDHVLLLTLHHIVGDGWSTGVLLRELCALYGAFVEGGASPLPEPAAQYADFAAWQRAHLTDDAVARQLDYWRDRLAGAPAVLELPADRPRPAVRTHAGARETVVLPAELRDALHALARREGCTPYMALLAGFQLLLWRYSGQEDLVVGSPVAGRGSAETEEMIGFFVNTLVLRGDLSGDPTFRELLGRTRETALGAFQHQDVPFERLVGELQPERSASHTPLFQVMFVLQNAAPSAPRMAGLEVRGLGAGAPPAQFDLTLSATDTERGVVAALDFDADLFEPESVRRMAAHLEVVLRAAVAEPGRRLSELPLLAPAERERVVRGWNDTARAYPAGDRVHALFAARAALAPDAPAVMAGDEVVTYGELDARASRLARHLRGLGVGAESRVGIRLALPAEAVAAVLAVLRAGGAYVPLDPGLPRERLEEVVADAGIRVVVTQASLADGLPAGVRAVRVDADAVAVAAESAAPLEVETPAESLAYVIYTSGSTGRPKGVMVTHAAVANLTHAFVEAHGFLARHRILVLPPLSFDASVGDLFPALAAGAALVFHPDPAALTGRTLPGWCARRGVTTVDTAAALWKTWTDDLAEAGGEVDFGPLEMVMMGGEGVDMERVRLWERWTGGRVQIVNHYGPTEATVCATVHLAFGGPPPAHSPASLPIGRPVANARVYVLDAAGAPVPVGAFGELYIGGAGVARGYQHRPDATAERFVPDPFGGEPGARLYRTGDRVRWLADGTLEFAGRVDHQLKLRGYRVEPGEVEAVLREHPGVREALVVARDDAPGGTRLVGYVVAAGGEVPGAPELRRHLAARLPEYMVPAAFVVLDALPLTPNGKVDRRALPRPDFAAGGEEYVAPRSPAEAKIAGIWAEVLGVERVGVHDNFFALGGHSLLAARVVSRVREALGADLSVRALFENPTLSGVSEAVGAARAPGPRPGDSIAEISLADPAGSGIADWAPRPLSERLHAVRVLRV